MDNFAGPFTPRVWFEPERYHILSETRQTYKTQKNHFKIIAISTFMFKSNQMQYPRINAFAFYIFYYKNAKHYH